MTAGPFDYGKGASLLGDEEPEAVDRVMRSRSLFRCYGPGLQGTVRAFESALRRARRARRRRRVERHRRPAVRPAIERWHTFDAPTGDTALGRLLGENPVPVELVEWALGPVRVVSIPGEGFHALGNAVEARAGGKVIVAGLAPIWQGYFPMPSTEGYEEETSYGRPFVSAVVEGLLGR